jgi:hypothetical protein
MLVSLWALPSLTRPGALFGPSELIVPLCLLLVAARHRPRRRVVSRAARDGAAKPAPPVRVADESRGESAGLRTSCTAAASASSA